MIAALVAGGEARGWRQLVLNPFADESATSFAALWGEGLYECRSCDHLWEAPSLRSWLRRRLTVFNPDLVHAHLFHATVVVASLPRRAGERRIVTHHQGSGLASGSRHVGRPRLDRIAMHRFDRVVAVSDSGRRFLLDSYRCRPETTVAIPNGWEGESGPPPVTQRRPTVVCVGLFRPEKGHATLLAAFALVRRELPDARLVLVGDGELRKALIHQIQASGLDGSVELAGRVDNVWPHLRNADVFAQASSFESFGIAIVEAMAAGLPVVGPAVGGIPELIVPGLNGELYPPGDVQALAGHLVHLLRSPGTRSRMGAESRRIADRFRMNMTVERYFELYDSLLCRRFPPSPQESP